MDTLTNPRHLSTTPRRDIYRSYDSSDGDSAMHKLILPPEDPIDYFPRLAGNFQVVVQKLLVVLGFPPCGTRCVRQRSTRLG